MEIGSRGVKVEYEGVGVLGGFSALGVLKEDPIENHDVLLPTDEWEAKLGRLVTQGKRNKKSKQIFMIVQLLYTEYD